jgi:hypothetical protein
MPFGSTASDRTAVPATAVTIPVMSPCPAGYLRTSPSSLADSQQWFCDEYREGLCTIPQEYGTHSGHKRCYGFCCFDGKGRVMIGTFRDVPYSNESVCAPRIGMPVKRRVFQRLIGSSGVEDWPDQPSGAKQREVRPGPWAELTMGVLFVEVIVDHERAHDASQSQDALQRVGSQVTMLN